MHRIGKAFGIIDIDLLDDSITNDQLLEFQAVAWIDGWHHGRSQTADILAEVRNLGTRLIVHQSSNPEQAYKAAKWVSGYELIERQTNAKPKKREMMTPEQFQKHCEAHYGR